MGRNLAQEWPLRNDQIVLLALSGTMTQEEIGEIFGMTRQNVALILKHDRAKEIIQIARARLRENLVDTIEGELDLASRAAVEVIKRTLNADISPVHKAKPNQDRVAVALLRGRGFMREEGKGAEGGLQVPADQFANFVESLRKADAAREIDPFAGQEVIDVEVEVVEEPSG